MPQPLPAVDPNVKLPSRVAAASAAADAIHQQAYRTPASPQPEPTSSPASDPEPAPSPAPQPAPPPAIQPEPQPQPAPQPPQPGPQTAPQPDRAPAAGDLSQDEWRHRYLSMEGRYKQTAVALGSMQEQMSELGDELMRTQDVLQQARATSGASVQPHVPAPAEFLTAEEVQSYGPELIDVIQRAARAAVMPDLRNMHTGVRQVSQRMQQVSTLGVHQSLDEHVPNWRTINTDPRFVAWCRLPDIYSGAIRGNLLKQAFQAGHAARVIAFFNGFLDEEQATGQLPDPSAQQPALLPPRAPALPLEMLAAPGRARPATGAQPDVPADKPIFTRAQIKAFYDAVRAQQYAGRQPEKDATEQAIFAAQREGRVR